MVPGSHWATLCHDSPWQVLKLESSAEGKRRNKQKVNQTHLNFRYRARFGQRFPLVSYLPFMPTQPVGLYKQNGQLNCEGSGAVNKRMDLTKLVLYVCVVLCQLDSNRPLPAWCLLGGVIKILFTAWVVDIGGRLLEVSLMRFLERNFQLYFWGMIKRYHRYIQETGLFTFRRCIAEDRIFSF